MKRISLFMMVALITISTAVFSQSKNKSMEVLYFKAKQCACRARVCDALEDQIKTSIEKDFPGEKIEFKRVWLNEKENEGLIAKYNAKPQTVVAVTTKKNKETITDLTEVVHKFTLDRNQDEFESVIKSMIAENL